MSEQMMHELLARLDALAAKLGVAGEQVWRIMVRGVFREGLIDAIIGVLAGGIGICLLMLGMKRLCSWSNKPWSYEREMGEGIAIGMCAVGGLVLLFGILAVVRALPEVFNPEYKALHELITLLKR